MDTLLIGLKVMIWVWGIGAIVFLAVLLHWIYTDGEVADYDDE